MLAWARACRARTEPVEGGPRPAPGITQIADRLDRITALLARLRSGSPLTEADLAAAQEEAQMSAHAAARAHANDKRSHRDAPNAHERAAAQFDLMGDHGRAAAHRAAAARDAAAAGHDDAAGDDDATSHRPSPDPEQAESAG